MAKMKELQPEMEKLKERAGDDKQKIQKEMMELYKREKVNPASGCLPIFLQIPIFFSLYKVIFVTLELRQAPWIGWIRDLSAPDPSSILNLFGLLPYAPPEPGSMLATVSLGLLPILLETSLQAQILIPLVTSLIFGLLAASLIVLFSLPAIYAILDDMGLSTLAKERKKKERAAKA